jgi:hypothetical protein
VSVDLGLAVHSYKLSAEAGDPRGQCQYANCLKKGQRVAADIGLVITITPSSRSSAMLRLNIYVAFASFLSHRDVEGNTRLTDWLIRNTGGRS